jgi:hypothetical protein
VAKPPKLGWYRQPIQPASGMELMSKIDQFTGGALAPDESKFEKPEVGPFGGTAARAHFGRKLQQIFALPSNGSEPENIRILLWKIEAKFDNVPGDG